jgi:hypothetical protein
MIVYGGFLGAELGTFSSSVYSLNLETLEWEMLFDSGAGH